MPLDPAALAQGLDNLFGRFENLWASSALIASFTFEGTQFDCRGNAPTYRALLRDGLCTAAAAPSRKAQILLLDAQGPRWTATYFQEREVEAALRGTNYFLAHDPDRGFWQAFDRSTGRGLQVMRGSDGYPPWETGSPLRNFMHWQVLRAGRGLIHAGTLAEGETGVLLVGEGGSGKSGTVLAGLLNGLSTVGDDYVLAEMKHGPSIRPIFRTLKQDRKGASRLGLDLSDRNSNWQGKLQMTVEEVAPGALLPRIIPIAVLCPRIANAASTSFSPLDPRTAFQALAPSGVRQIPGDRAAAFALAGSVVRAVPCYTMELGTDPAEIAAAIRGFIRQGGA